MNKAQQDAAKQKWMDLPKPTYSLLRPHLHVFDFDGTLFRSHSREEGELILEQVGEKWPFGGWWGRKETLEPPFVLHPPQQELLIEHIAQKAIAVYNDPNAYSTLMTGRPVKLRNRIQEILAHFEIKFHEEYYRGMRGIPCPDTITYKIYVIKERLCHDKLQSLEIWEDRPEHIGRFIALGAELKSRHKIKKVIIHDVATAQDHEL